MEKAQPMARSYVKIISEKGVKGHITGSHGRYVVGFNGFGDGILDIFKVVT